MKYQLVCRFLLVLLFWAFTQDAVAVVWPISNSYTFFADEATSPFGPRNLSPFGASYDYHRGLDLEASYVSVHAIMKGQVIFSGWDNEGGGNTISIKHPYPFDEESEYKHLSERYFDADDSVNEGDVIAESGCTGTCFGAHLHIGYYFVTRDEQGNETKTYYNPVNVLPYGNAECPDLETYYDSVIYSGSGAVDYVINQVITPYDELDFDGLYFWLYDTTHKMAYIDIEDYELLRDPTQGIVTLFPGDPTFQATVTIQPHVFNSLSSQKIRIKFDPLNNDIFLDHRFLGIRAVDLDANFETCTFWSDWGNTTGESPYLLMNSFSAQPQKEGIKLVFALNVSSFCEGVDVFRSKSLRGEFVRVNEQPIKLKQEGEEEWITYSYVDKSVVPGITYYYKLQGIDGWGNAGFLSDIVSAMIIPDFALNQNYPNPFNKSTIINYDIDSEKPIRTALSVHNILGQKVKSLVDEQKPAGHYQIEWDGTNEKGHSVSSGVYFYVLKTDKNIDRKKMLLLK